MLYQNKNKTGDYKDKKCVLWSDFTEYIWVVAEDNLSEWDREETVKNHWRRDNRLVWSNEGKLENQFRREKHLYWDELYQSKVEMQPDIYVSWT